MSVRVRYLLQDEHSPGGGQLVRVRSRPRRSVSHEQQRRSRHMLGGERMLLEIRFGRARNLPRMEGARRAMCHRRAMHGRLRGIEVR